MTLRLVLDGLLLVYLNQIPVASSSIHSTQPFAVKDYDPLTVPLVEDLSLIGVVSAVELLYHCCTVAWDLPLTLRLDELPLVHLMSVLVRQDLLRQLSVSSRLVGQLHLAEGVLLVSPHRVALTQVVVQFLGMPLLS